MSRYRRLVVALQDGTNRTTRQLQDVLDIKKHLLEVTHENSAESKR
jgi:hypothetical protein